MALTAALLHSPSTHNRAEGVGGRRYRLEIQYWSLNFRRSRDEELQTKRHLQRAFHASESIEGPGKRKGTFEVRRRDRHAIACRRSSKIERRNGSHGRIPSQDCRSVIVASVVIPHP